MQKKLDLENTSAQVVHISGASGPNSKLLNGTYDPTKEKYSGRIRYAKRNEADVWIEFGFGRWQIKKTSDKGKNIGTACEAFFTAAWSSLESFVGRCSWLVWIGSSWEEQRAVKMEIGAAAERSFQIEEEASKQTDNSKAQCIVISGVVGSKCVNGTYEPTSERHEGRVRYRMIGDEGKWIEHNDGDWCVKPAASKGENKGWAWVKGDCALEACASRTWRVFDQNGTKQTVEESSVKLRFVDKVMPGCFVCSL